MNWHETKSLLDTCHSLFLREIGEPEENLLRIVLHEGIVSDEPVALEICGTTFQNCHSVKPTSHSRVFELICNRYIAYSVTNESFGIPVGDEADDSGRLLRRYINSPFLDYVAISTCATKDYPGPFTHVCVISENHVIDVISTEMPILRSL
jgi:hypothetical protein